MGTAEFRMKLILWGTALHSCAIGLGLLLTPESALARFGFGHVSQRFFPMQGGVFHLLMGLAYILASRELAERLFLVRYAIAVKFVAVCFLFGFYFAMAPLRTVLLSGASDLVIGTAILIAYLDLRRGGMRSGGITA